MKPSGLFERSMRSFPNVCLCTSGPRAVAGKSQVVAQAASDLGWQFLDIRAGQLHPGRSMRIAAHLCRSGRAVPPKFLSTSGKGILVPGFSGTAASLRY